MKAVIYAPSAVGGTPRYAYELLSALTALGTPEPSLVTSVDLEPKYRDVPYRVHAVLPPLRHRSAFGSKLSWGLDRVRHYVRRERTFLHWLERHPDEVEIIHLQEFTPWLAPLLFGRLKAGGRRLFVTVHNIYPHRYLHDAVRPLHRRWIGSAWRRCDGLFVHTEALRDQLAEFLGPGHPPIFVTPHGVWSAPADGVEALDPLQRLERRELVFFGVIRRNKGLPVLLSALRQLPECRLTVAGDFDDPYYRDEIASDLDSFPPGTVELLDRYIEDDEVARIFARSTLAILPYTSFAAQSGVLHDALAHGIPLVVSDVGSLGETVRGQGIGEVAPAGDAAALTDAIRRMLEPDRYLAAVAAIEDARQTLSWDRTAEATAAGYFHTATPDD